VTLAREHYVHVEILVSLVLRIGVVLAFIIVVTSGTLYLIHHPGEVTNFQSFTGDTSDLRSLGSIFRLALALRTDALIQLGLVTLIATPIARVFLSAVGFAIDGDGLYLAISSIVLGVLLYGLSHAI